MIMRAISLTNPEKINTKLESREWLTIGESLIIYAGGGACYVNAIKGEPSADLKSSLQVENCHRMRKKGFECIAQALLQIPEEKDGGEREAFLGYLGLEGAKEDKSSLQTYLNNFWSRPLAPQLVEEKGLDEDDNKETNPIKRELEEIEQRAKRVEEAKGWACL